MMTRAYVGVGSNLAHPKKQVEAALISLGQNPHLRVIAQSSLYLTRPMGVNDQPDFVNAVVSIDTDLTANALLQLLHTLEAQQGRNRSKEQRWGPRVLDLDLLLYGNLNTSDDILTVPHPRMREREFVLHPLAEIAPDLILPSGESILTLKHEIPWRGMVRLT